jgi:chromosome segregation ATPase
LTFDDTQIRQNEEQIQNLTQKLNHLLTQQSQWQEREEAYLKQIDDFHEQVYHLKNSSEKSKKDKEKKLSLSELADQEICQKILEVQTKNMELKKQNKEIKQRTEEKMREALSIIDKLNEEKMEWKLTAGLKEKQKKVDQMRKRMKMKIEEIGNLRKRVQELESKLVICEEEKLELQESNRKKYEKVGFLLEDYDSKGDDGKEKYGKAVEYVLQKNKVLLRRYKEMEEKVRKLEEGGAEEKEEKKKRIWRRRCRYSSC